MGSPPVADFEDDRLLLQKDAQMRRRYLRWFNKTRSDFSSDKDHDDYLEMVEETIYKLVHDIDVEKTKALVEEYRRKNQDIIGVNQAKKMEEERLLAEHVAQQERERIERLNELRKEDERERAQRERERKQFEADELLRVTKGEDEFKRMLRKRERKERRKRKEEAVLAKKKRKLEPDIQPTWFKPAFANPPPVPMHATRKNNVGNDGRSATPDDLSKEATAGGFLIQLVVQRAAAEFSEMLAVQLHAP